jgi:O-antigen/teichoic acid export membrane protein
MVLTAFSALAISNVGSALVYAGGRAWFVAASGLAGAVLSLVSCAFVIPVWGAWGASLSRSLVQSSMVAAGVWYIGRYLGCPMPVRALGKILLAAATAALCSYAAVTAAPRISSLAVAVPAAALVYLSMLRMTRAVERDDARLLRDGFGRLPATVAAPLVFVMEWLAI